MLYDRTTGSIVRVAHWRGDTEPQWEYWSGVTDASLMQDQPDDGFDTGQYHAGRNRQALVPASTRRALRGKAPS